MNLSLHIGEPLGKRISDFVMLVTTIVAVSPCCFSQTTPDLQTYFKEDIRLSDNQITSIRAGQAIAKTLPSRTPAEIFVFGAVYVNAVPESYVKFSRDFDHLRRVLGYLAMGEFSNPPQLSDLQGFTFDSEEIEALKNCKPGDCQIQIPSSAIEDFKRTIDWAAPDVDDQVNQRVQKTLLERLTAYQHDGSQILGVYNDKRNPTEVPRQFEYMLSYSNALPRYLPDFYHYLLTYPKEKPANVEDTFYWDKVKFGLKPTLRVVHVVTMYGNSASEPAYVIAEKQLYSSHYFETALDLTFCIRDSKDPTQPGFYLIKAMGSEQAGLTGIKGSVVRKVAVERSASSLQKSLTVIKNTLEHNQ